MIATMRDRGIASMASEMYTEIVTVTPELAAEWLKKNTDNRALRNWHVESLASAILRDEWVLTHQGVAFSTDGRLIDGQHRLAAIVRANRPVLISVTRNVVESAFKTIDQGIKRTLSDVFGVDSRIMEPVRAACTIYYGNSRTTPDRVEAIYESGLGATLAELVAFCGTSRRVFSSANFKLGAAISIMDGSEKGYVMTQYKAMLNLDVDNLSNASKAILKQVQQGTCLSKRSGDLLARSLIVFDQSKRDCTKIQISDTGTQSAYERVRKVIGKHMRGA